MISRVHELSRRTSNYCLETICIPTHTIFVPRTLIHTCVLSNVNRMMPTLLTRSQRVRTNEHLLCVSIIIVKIHVSSFKEKQNRTRALSKDFLPLLLGSIVTPKS